MRNEFKPCKSKSIRSNNKQVESSFLSSSEMSPELLKKHSMNLSPFLHIASAFRIKFSPSPSSKQLLPANFRWKLQQIHPRLKNDGTVFARDIVKMFQNMQKKRSKIVLPDRLKESNPVTSMSSVSTLAQKRSTGIFGWLCYYFLYGVSN